MKTKGSLICILIFVSVLGWASVAHAQGSNAESKDVKEWKRYYLSKGQLSVLLPTDPQEDVQEKTAEYGLIVDSYTFTANIKPGAYVVSHVVLPEAAEKWAGNTLEFFYNGVWQGIAKTFDTEFEKKGVSWKTNLIEKRKIQFSGHEGREISFSIGIINGRVMMTLVGHQAFTAMVFGTEDISTDDQEKFFKSITINVSPIKK